MGRAIDEAVNPETQARDNHAYSPEVLIAPVQTAFLLQNCVLKLAVLSSYCATYTPKKGSVMVPEGLSTFYKFDCSQVRQLVYTSSPHFVFLL